MTDLVTQAYVALSLPRASATDVLLFPQLATAASRLVRGWTNRDWTSQKYDQVFTVDNPNRFLLPQFPVNRVLRVATNPQPILTINQTDTSTNQLAYTSYSFTGDVDSGVTPDQTNLTGLSLFRTASGVVATPQSFLWATYPTVGALAAAINSFGAGWLATADPSYLLWPSADFTPDVIDQPCLGTSLAQLISYVSDVPASVDQVRGVLSIQASSAGSIDSFKFWPGSVVPGDDEIQGGFLGYRIIYNAGYATIPADIQQATIDVLKAMLERLNTDSSLISESDGVYSWDAREVWEAVPRHVRQILTLHRNERA